MTHNSVHPVTRGSLSRARMCAALFAFVTLAPFGCGETTLGEARSNHDGGAAEGGASGNGGSTAFGGSTSGGSTTGGSAGNGGADAGKCKAPLAAPNPNPTPEERARTDVARAYCEAFAGYGCLDLRPPGISSRQAKEECSADERLEACVQDVLYQHAFYVAPGATAPCDEEWMANLRCSTETDWAATGKSGDDLCREMDAFLMTKPASPGPCQVQEQALIDCRDQNQPATEVTGTRATCFYGYSPTNVVCYVTCKVGGNQFDADCSGPPGLPLRCSCHVNGRFLDDFNTAMVAGDCADAARRMADGECINRTDCCVSYFDGMERCLCTADPQRVFDPQHTGETVTCESAAQAAGGTVVDLCPQYAPVDSIPPPNCWPPGSC
jgi:hypothetical protein